MNTAQFFMALGVGALSGVLAALCGVGGGLIMVPAFVFLLAVDQKSAVATSLTAILFISLVATAKYSAASLVKWQLAVPVVLGAVVTTWFATDWLKHLSNDLLSRIFGILMILVGIRMLLMK
jgi:uncharacterized membrane protein YfcA